MVVGGAGLDRTLFNQRSHAFSLGILKLLKELTQNVLLLKKKMFAKHILAQRGS